MKTTALRLVVTGIIVACGSVGLAANTLCPPIASVSGIYVALAQDASGNGCVWPAICANNGVFTAGQGFSMSFSSKPAQVNNLTGMYWNLPFNIFKQGVQGFDCIYTTSAGDLSVYFIQNGIQIAGTSVGVWIPGPNSTQAMCKPAGVPESCVLNTAN